MVQGSTLVIYLILSEVLLIYKEGYYMKSIVSLILYGYMYYKRKNCHSQTYNMPYLNT